MTKAELVALVAKNAGTSPREAETVLNGFRDVVQVNVKAGKEVSYPGLGKFSRAARKARTARNPRTGETLKVPATKVPRFAASEGFKRVVKGDAPAPKLAR
jgi:DNA-binding protein HU-beta